MPARFNFPSTGSAAVAPAFGSLWQATPASARRPLVSTPSNTGDVNSGIAEALAGNAYAGRYQFVSEPLAPGMWLSSFVLRALVANTTAGNATSLAARIALVNNAGTTIRAELYAGRSAASTTSSTFAAQEIAAAVAQTTTNDGDRLVVELGLHHTNTVSTSVTGSIRFGDPTATADIAAVGATTGRGYFEGTFDGPKHGVGAVSVESLSSGDTRRIGGAVAETLYEGDERRVGDMLVETMIFPRTPLLSAAGAQVYIKHPDGRWEPVWLNH